MKAVFLSSEMHEKFFSNIVDLKTDTYTLKINQLHLLILR
jgi:hypothetical protein